jgi:hypothetical protein
MYSFKKEISGMPAPFSGMDPFLEKPGAWSGVHSRLINTISDILADLVLKSICCKRLNGQPKL